MTSDEGESEAFFEALSILSPQESLGNEKEALKKPLHFHEATNMEHVEFIEMEEHTPLHSLEDAGNYADFTSSSISLLKTILGAGLLAMPAAMASVGWVFGTAFIFLSATLAQLGLVLLAKCAERLGTRNASISSIAQVTYPKSAKLVDLALALKCFGVAASYLIVIGDMMPSIASGMGCQSELLQSRKLWICLSMFIVAPLAFLPKLDSLKYTSLAGLIAVFYMVWLAASNAIWPGNQQIPIPGNEPVAFAPFSISALKSFSVFIFAFTAHQNICTIQGEATEPTAAFIMPVIKFSIWTSSLVYFLFSMLTYMTYGQGTASNAFLNFPAFAYQMIFGRVLYALLSAFSYPLLTHPCRASMLKLMPFSSRFMQANHEFIYRTITTLIVLGTLLMSMIVEDLGIVSALLGTFIGIPICYFVPGFYYHKITQHEGSSRGRRLALGLAGFGILAMITSSISILASIFPSTH